MRQLPVGRTLLLDERGSGLRATWHHDRGIANLSVWRGDRCVETFHLSVHDAAELVGFLVAGLAEAAGAGTRGVAGGAERVGPPTRAAMDQLVTAATAQVRLARQRLATWLAP